MGTYFLLVYREQLNWFHVLVLGCWPVLQFEGMDWFFCSRLRELRSGEERVRLIERHKIHFACFVVTLALIVGALAIMFYWLPEQLFAVRK
jgi:hypothetical protein